MTCSENGGIRIRFWAESRLLFTNNSIQTGHVMHRASYQVYVGDVTQGMKLVLRLRTV